LGGDQRINKTIQFVRPKRGFGGAQNKRLLFILFRDQNEQIRN